MGNKALIAMSGGIDSSVAAYIMKQRGYECIGATMKLFQNEDIGVSREHSCCSLDDVQDARSVAYKLDIPYYVYNFADRFAEKVIDNFVGCYEKGITPNPCIECNRHLKFKYLYTKARELGLDYIVTGHYSDISYNESTGRYVLKKAADPAKDQSYVLYSLTQDQLAHTIFPLAGIPKTEVRQIARDNGFVNANKLESQDICFVRNGSYADFIREYTGRDYPEGNFVDLDGNVLGRHKGIINYTVGQRKGLGISLAKPVYVVAVNPCDNTVVLGDNADLYTRELTATNINLISLERIEKPMHLKAKIRYKHQEQWALVSQTDDDTIKVVFDEAQRAITKGQAVVLYDGDTVVGGGTINTVKGE